MYGVIRIAQILRILSTNKPPLPIIAKDSSQSQPNPNHIVLVHKKGGQKTFHYVVFAKHEKRTNQQYS